MSIKAYVDELTMINAEIKRNKEVNKKLGKRLKEIETNITSYLKEKEQSGLKYNGKAILLENKEHKLSKNKKDLYEDTINLLENLGINNPVEVYNKLQEVKEGNLVEKTKLKIKKIPNSYS